MTDIKAMLDEIAFEAAQKIANDTNAPATIRAAIDKALEVVLTAEPSEGMTSAGFVEYCNETAMSGERHCSLIYRAMSSALLEELKK